jgi:competence protein ComEC
MNKSGVIAGCLLIGLGIRIYSATRPISIPDGTVVKLNFEVTSREISKEGKGLINYRGIRISVPADQWPSSGDRVKVIGRISSEVTEGGGKQKVLNWSDFKKIDSENSLIKAIKPVNLFLKEMILAWLPGDTGALGTGILLGGAENLSYRAAEAFKNSGLSHVTAASGYNVSVVAGILMAGLARKWGKRRVIPFGIFCVFLYVLLAGATAAVVRAGIMVSLVLLARYLGKEAQSGWLLGVSAWVMLMANPLWIVDIGFQLSVAATAGILAAGKGGAVWWKSDLRTTLAAQVTTLPLILHHFGNLSVWAPVINLLVLWCVPWIMELLLAAVVIGGGVDWLGRGIAYLAWPLLTWMVKLTEWAGNWPGNGWEVGKLSWWWVGVYYSVIGYGWARLKSGERK